MSASDHEDVPVDITIERTDTAITIDGRVTYEWGARRRPYIHPLCTPAGVCLTRNAPEDHPWHHGLWFTIKYINSDNFWEEYGDYGVLRHYAEPRTRQVGIALDVSGPLTWTRPDRETRIIDEHRRVLYRPISDDSYGLVFSTHLRPLVDVVLDRTPFTTWGGYGGLAFRGRRDWHDTRILLDDGMARERAFGEPSAWFAMDGLVGEDDAPAGIVIVSAPSNPRHPQPWYASTKASTYGDDGWANFANAAFLWDKPMSLERGCELPLRYHIIVHDGLWDTDRIAAAIAEWSVPLEDEP